jgi:hypothetical protein
MFPKANRTEAAGAYTPCPAGNHGARLYMLVDLGLHEKTWQGETKIKHLVHLGWELPDEPMEDGRPYTISARLTYSLHEKATLRKFLEGWRGSKFTDEEAADFDITKLVGKACMVQVAHRQGGNGNTYADVIAVTSLPRGMQVPPPVNDRLVYSPEYHDAAIFERLSPNLKKFLAERIQDAGRVDSGFDSEVPF